MKLATIALVRSPNEDRQQLGEMTLRSFGILANKGRQGADRITVSLLLVEDLAEVRDLPDVTMIVACGNHELTEQKDGVHRFRSIGDMQKGVVEVLQRRFPIGEPHPELPLAHGAMATTAPLCPTCGHSAVRNGAAYKCHNCGQDIGHS